MTTTSTTTRAAAAGGLLGLLLAGLATAAAPAGATPSDVFTVGGGGISSIDGNGSIVLEDGPALVTDKHLREQLDATLDVVVAPADGSIPAPNECEPASATFAVDGRRDVAMTLAGDGTLCAITWPFAPNVVSLRFEGLYTVLDARRPWLTGDAGTFTVWARANGFLSASTSSFVPS